MSAARPKYHELERIEQTRMSELQAAIAAPVPAAATIADVDPQVTVAVGLAQWAGVNLTAANVGNLRLAMMGLLPNLAGLVLAFSVALREAPPLSGWLLKLAVASLNKGVGRSRWKGSSRVFDGAPEGLTKDDILDNVTLYYTDRRRVLLAAVPDRLLGSPEPSVKDSLSGN